MAEANVRCPFLVPVMADRLWVYSIPVYCRRPNAQVKAPAPETFSRVCLSHRHLRCEGYLASADSGQSPGA